MEKLFSPWRLRYITSVHDRGSGCVFCRAARGRRDRANLVLSRGISNFVILNKYPYNNGHLMIVPFAHVPRLADTSPETLHEMMALAVRCETALRTAYRPTGINLGMNLGRSAGAGIDRHLHLHVVPRWDGDTNFMSVIHGTRVLPESLQATYGRLRPLLQGEGPAPRGTRPPAQHRARFRRKSRRGGE
ncbi:MAG TPA: HIT domain-containing protein [Candidatus Methylomirabilis sp.]|nr:HIT domain-containing protein [Candidatus Methylomirabilis sp.]